MTARLREKTDKKKEEGVLHENSRAITKLLIHALCSQLLE